MRNLLKMLKNRVASNKIGLVEEFNTDVISGSIYKTDFDKAKAGVDLFINETFVLKAPLQPARQNRLSFEIGMYDVWRFAQRSDRVSVKFAGQALPMPNGAFFMHPNQDGKENLEKLRQRFASGQSFDARGRIAKVGKDLDYTWQEGVMSLYQDVDRVIYQVTGSRSFIYSGTLLGYVRDRGFIPHDKDMDCAYLSRKTTTEQVAEEFAAIGERLIAAGYSVTPKASCISVRRATGSKIMVDVAHLFVKDDGMVGFPFGRVGTAAVAPSVFEPVMSGYLAGYQVGLPARPQDVVGHVYGEEWKIPDPDFKWRDRRRSRDAQPLLTYTQRTRLAMDDFYSRPEVTEPSNFARWLVEARILPALAVAYDLGCGNGRDLTVLSEVASTVCGIERSSYAFEAAVKEVAGNSRVDVVQADLLEEGSIARITDHKVRTGPRLFYQRFLLNGLTHDQQRTLLSAMSFAMAPGDIAAFEHRTTLDEPLRKARFRSYRRFVDTLQLRRELTDLGFEIMVCDEGTGYAPFEREDPYVVRLVAKRL